jgi:hypothetical protein
MLEQRTIVLENHFSDRGRLQSRCDKQQHQNITPNSFTGPEAATVATIRSMSTMHEDEAASDGVRAEELRAVDVELELGRLKLDMELELGRPRTR